jgi:nucleoside-diphosphate-sugar epimerase
VSVALMSTIVAVIAFCLSASAGYFINDTLDAAKDRAHDVVEVCVRAARSAGPAIYNVGAEQFTSMRGTLESLCVHAGTGAKVRSLPARPAAALMKAASVAGLAPFSDYHWLVYGMSVYFDVSAAKQNLGWSSSYSNQRMFADAYDLVLVQPRVHLGCSRLHTSQGARSKDAAQR